MDNDYRWTDVKKQSPRKAMGPADLLRIGTRDGGAVMEHSGVDRREIRDRWTRDGFVVLDGFLSQDELEPTTSTLDSMFPTASEFHDDFDPDRNESFRTQFGGIVNFPFSNVELSLLSVHPRLVELAQSLLETDEVRAYSIEGWAKYTGAADYEQPLHRDYLNHTLLVPSDDTRYKQVEMFLYLCDVPDDLGPPSFVARQHTDSLSALPNWYPPTDRPADIPADESGWFASTGSPDLYAKERSGKGRAGTLVAYTTLTFHRGRQLTQPRGARYTIHVNFRPADVEWGRAGHGSKKRSPTDGATSSPERPLTSSPCSAFRGPATRIGRLRRLPEWRLAIRHSTWRHGAGQQRRVSHRGETGARRGSLAIVSQRPSRHKSEQNCPSMSHRYPGDSGIGCDRNRYWLPFVFVVVRFDDLAVTDRREINEAGRG